MKYDDDFKKLAEYIIFSGFDYSEAINEILNEYIYYYGTMYEGKSQPVKQDLKDLERMTKSYEYDGLFRKMFKKIGLDKKENVDEKTALLIIRNHVNEAIKVIGTHDKEKIMKKALKHKISTNPDDYF